MFTVGIDEVGRGCWAGPLVAAAVLLADPVTGLKDSKKLTKRHRERLDDIIRTKALAYGIGWVTPDEVDELGLTDATRQAMIRALTNVTTAYDEVIIDGNLNFLADLPNTRCLIKADDTIPAVSAASVIAKVARDNYMANLDASYAAYGFEKHVGYGTAAHLQALKQYGVSDLHRRSFKPIQALLQ